MMIGDGLAFVALLLFSSNVFVVRSASRSLGQDAGFLVVLVVNVLAAAAAVAVLAVVQGVLPPPSWRPVALFVAGGLLSSYLGRRGYFRTIELIGPSRASTLQVTSPAFALVLAWALLGQQLSLAQSVALVCVVLGLTLTTLSAPAGVAGGPVAGAPGSRPRRGIPAAAVVLGLAGSAWYALGNVVRGAAVLEWQEPLVGALLGALGAALGYAAVSLRQPRVRETLRRARGRELRLWALAGVLTIAGQTSLIAATAHVPVAVAVAIAAAVPVVVVPVSLVLLRAAEQLTPLTVLGSAGVVGGVVVLVLL